MSSTITTTTFIHSVEYYCKTWIWHKKQKGLASKGWKRKASCSHLFIWSHIANCLTSSLASLAQKLWSGQFQLRIFAALEAGIGWSWSRSIPCYSNLLTNLVWDKRRFWQEIVICSGLNLLKLNQELFRDTSHRGDIIATSNFSRRKFDTESCWVVIHWRVLHMSGFQCRRQSVPTFNCNQVDPNNPIFVSSASISTTAPHWYRLSIDCLFYCYITRVGRLQTSL